MNFSRHLENVTDSSDWNESKIPSLYQLEALQRCFICKEFMTAPVITSCNHTFCSRCIRQYLLSNNCCPLCKSQQFESNLRRVVVLEEIINCFTSIRPYLLEALAKEDLGDQNGEEEGVNDDADLKRGRAMATPETSEVVEVFSDEEPAAKRTKLEDDDLVECPVCVRRMPAEFLQTKHIDQCLSGDANAPMPKNDTSVKVSRPKPRPKNTSISSFFRASGKQQSTKKDVFKDNHENFYFNETEKHVTKDKRLPKLDFSSLTTPKLKEKLHNLHIATSGTRHQLELRYNQYYILYNSNLDSNRPVDVKILQAKLNQWESGHSAFSTGTSTLFDTATNGMSSKNITDRDFAATLWKRAYQQEFRELISQAQKARRIMAPDSDARATEPYHPPKSSTEEVEEKVQLSQPNAETVSIRHGLHNSILFVPESS